MSPLSIQTFCIDVTPPVGDYLCGGPRGKSLGVETPLWLRGIIFNANQTRYVIASIEFCYLVGTSYWRVIDALAVAAGVPVEQVTLHATHVHDAPLIDEDTQRPLETIVPGLFNENSFAKLESGVRKGVEQAFGKTQICVNGIGFAEHAVKDFASNRRVIGADGTCRTRWSICEDQMLRDAPVGRIDPLLRSVVLYGDASEPIASLFFYASHPQVSDGRGLYSSDAPGLAIELFQKSVPGVFAMYFTGCAGDITAGKYTTTDKKRNREVFGHRLYDSMSGAFDRAVPEKIDVVAWRNSWFHLPLARQNDGADHWQSFLKNPDVSPGGIFRKTVAAGRLRRLTRRISEYPFRLSRLRINNIDLLFLPAEMLINYQLFASSIAPGHLAVAAYGDSFLGYVPTDECFAQGGYEVDSWCTEVDRGAEPLIKQHIQFILESQ